MLKKSITYTDFNGEEVTEDFFFNLTKAELIEIEMGHEGGLSESLKKIIATEDGAKIISEFKSIILKAYGERSVDGKRFVKSQHARDQFESTEAYSVLFVELVTDPDAAAEFVRAIMPGDLMAQAQLTMETTAVTETPEPTEPTFIPPQQPKLITRAEAMELDPAAFAAGLASGSLKMIVTSEDLKEIDRDDFNSNVASGRYVFTG